MADLLGSILGSMEKPPTLDEHQQQHAKKQQQQQNKLEQLQEKERIRLESFKKTIQQTVQKFVNSSDEKLKLKPMEVNCRAIIHEISDAAGLTSFSFGDEDVDRHVVLWKKEFAPCDQEITALRNGDEWDPEKAKLQAKLKLEQLEAEQNDRLADKVIPKCNYQEKYQHLIGTVAAKDAAQTTNANRSYGFVPSENKRDQRTIEQVMADNKARKKIKTTHEPDSEDS